MTDPKVANAMPLVVIAALAVPMTPALGSTMTFDFNTSGQLTGDLTFGAGGSPVSQAATGGLSNSGFVQGAAGSNAQSTVVAKTAVSTSTAADFTLTQSAYFKTSALDSLGSAVGDDILILGLTDSPTQSAANPDLLTNPTPNSHAGAIRMENPNDSGNIVVSFKGFNSNDVFRFGPSTTVSLSPDSWYIFEVDYAYLSGADDLLLTYTLNESDANGVVGTQLFNLTLNGAIRNNNFGANPDLYGFFGTDTQLDSSIAGFDNITLVSGVAPPVIPEPASAALVALGGLALMGRRRKH